MSTLRFMPILAAAVATAAACVSGCQAKPKPSPPAWLDASSNNSSASTMQALDPVSLQSDLSLLINNFYDAGVGLSSDIAAQTDSRTIREETLRWKLRLVAATEAIQREPDPRLAFLFAWLLVEEGYYGVTEGARRTTYGPFQPQVVEMLGRARDQMIALGYKHFDNAAIDDARDDMRQLATRNVLARWRASGSNKPPGELVAQRGRRSDVGALLSIPMSPFSGIQGVADTPTAIKDASEVVAEIGTTIRHLPERVRWNAALLLYELDHLPTVVALREDVAGLNASVAQVAARVDALPQDLRDLLTEAEAAQPELRQTLAESRAALAELDRTVQRLNTLAGSIDTMSGSVQGAAEQINKMIGRDRPADAVPPTQPKPPDPDPITISKLIELSEKITRATQELRGLAGDLDGPIDELDAASARTMGRATADLRALLDAATWRLAGVVVLAFVLAVVYRLVFRRARAGQ